MKNICTFILIGSAGLGSLTTCAQTPQLDWAMNIGGDGGDGGSVIATIGNSIISGGPFSNSVNFGSGQLELILNATELSGNQYILRKSDIGETVWVKAIYAGIMRFDAIVIDQLENIILAGLFLGPGDFDPSQSEYSLNSFGGYDVFVLKLNSDGEFLNAISFGGPGDDYITGMDVDSDGNVYLTGSFISTVDFDPDPDAEYLMTSFWDPDFFLKPDFYVMKLTESLEFVWARQYGELGEDEGNALVVDEEDNVWVTGLFWENILVDMASGEQDTIWAPSPAPAGYIMKLNSDGLGLLVKTFESSTASLTGRKLCTGNSGYVYIGGSTGTGIEIQTIDGPVVTTTGIFLLKSDLYGNIHWVTIFGGIPPGPQNGSRTFKEMSISPSGSVSMTGYFSQSLYFGLEVEAITFHGEKDIFLVSINENGYFEWAIGIGGVGEDRGNAVAWNNNGKLFVTGSFPDEVDFGLDGVPHILTSNGQADAFILKLSTDSLDIGMSKPMNQTDIAVWPNPSTGLFTLQTPHNLQNASVAVHDLTGRQVYRARLSGANYTLDLSSVPAGLYILSIGEGPGAQRIKILKE